MGGLSADNLAWSLDRSLVNLGECFSIDNLEPQRTFLLCARARARVCAGWCEERVHVNVLLGLHVTDLIVSCRRSALSNGDGRCELGRCVLSASARP